MLLIECGFSCFSIEDREKKNPRAAKIFCQKKSEPQNKHVSPNSPEKIPFKNMILNPFIRWPNTFRNSAFYTFLLHIFSVGHIKIELIKKHIQWRYSVKKVEQKEMVEKTL